MVEAADVVVVGDGPAGLSAALFLAKNGMDVQVFGQDETYLHDAYLYNYLGIEEIHGSDFVAVARRQVEGFGATLRDEHVVGIDGDDELTVNTEDGTTVAARYLLVATGPEWDAVGDLGLDFDGDVIDVDRNGRTSREDVYAAGWAARGDKIQAAVSVGDGAAAALDILSREEGQAFHDFDTPGG